MLQASGDELEAGLAYAMVEQLVAETARPPPELLAAIGTERVAEIAPVRMGAALVEMLGWLQADGPVVMVLDDAHWGDVPSLQALGYAMRRLRSSRVLALLSARDDRTDQLPASLRRLSDKSADCAAAIARSRHRRAAHAQHRARRGGAVTAGR